MNKKSVTNYGEGRGGGKGGEGGGRGGKGERETNPGTEKRCSHNLQSDPLASGF